MIIIPRRKFKKINPPKMIQSPSMDLLWKNNGGLSRTNPKLTIGQTIKFY